MKAFGVELVILSNAAGGLNNNFRVGNLMMIADHISFLANEANQSPSVAPAPARPLYGENQGAV